MRNKIVPNVDRYKIFCHSYLRSNNATQAALQAGYSPKSAKVTGSRLLTNANVQRILREMRKEFDAACLKTREDWIKELELIAFSRISDLCKWGSFGVEIYDSDALIERALASVAMITQYSITKVLKDGEEITRSKLRIDLHDKISALIKYGVARGFCKGAGAGGGGQRPRILINKLVDGGWDRIMRPNIEI